MMPYQGGKPPVPQAKQIGEGKYLIEEQKDIEGEIRAETKEYTIQKGDSLWKIAERELGSGHRWKYLYEINEDRIKNPNKLRAGTVIIIPVE